MYHYYTGSPEAPTNVTVKPQSLQTIQVTWVPGYDGGAHTIFTVQFKRSDSNSWTSTDAVNSNVTSTVLSNSEGWDGLFVFRVTAVNQFGSTESIEVSVALRGRFGRYKTQVTGHRSPVKVKIFLLPTVLSHLIG